LRRHDLVILGGESPIISVLVGDEENTFRAGKFLFDRGYYVQSVTFPAVEFHAGVLRIQVNANHRSESIDGLIEAFGELRQAVFLPSAEAMAATRPFAAAA
jgi:7-keto-8-aminopelargonate synthetase-like enzyme